MRATSQTFDEAPPTETTSPVDVLAAVRNAAESAGREDLMERLARAEERIARPDAILVLAGEFKQGKSSLANALIGSPISPVDDDLATAAVTVLRHGDEPSLRLHTRNARDDSGALAENGALPDLSLYITEGAAGQDGVELVEVRFPNPLLARGLTIVDTPGSGGVDPAKGAAVLSFLRGADALLFVTDAAAELSAPEMAFLNEARSLVPIVLVVLTKIDLFPEWRRIAAIDASRLASIGLSGPLAASAHVRTQALAMRDADLNLESGIPVVLAAISRDVLEARRHAAMAFASDEARAIIEQLRFPLEAEERAMADAVVGDDEPAARVAAARSRLAHLRGPGARSLARLNDGFVDLGSDVDHRFRADMRGIQRSFEEEADRIDPAAAWDDFASRLRGSAAQAVQEAHSRLFAGAQRIRDSLAELIREDDLASSGKADGEAPDVAALWTGRRVERTTLRSSAARTFGALRGAQGGVVMLGVVGQLAGLTLAGPVLVGAAAVFGARQVLEDRRKQVSTRRQEARTTVRQFVDDVQFEVAVRLRDLARDLQQRMRDDVSERLEELIRTASETVRALEAAAQRDERDRRARSVELATQLAALRELSSAIPR